jgi:hypothetical protein
LHPQNVSSQKFHIPCCLLAFVFKRDENHEKDHLNHTYWSPTNKKKKKINFYDLAFSPVAEFLKVDERAWLANQLAT